VPKTSSRSQLGVVDPTSGAFRPGAPIKRREFIRWLVKANNVLWADTPAKKVNLADTTETSVFPDVATSDPDFPYIQGMQDAGYSVGFPDKTFKPDQALTREQMFAIKNVFDRGSVDAGLVKDVNFARNTAMGPWKDKATISKTYVPGIATAIKAAPRVSAWCSVRRHSFVRNCRSRARKRPSRSA
jgi:hypothetical protein